MAQFEIYMIFLKNVQILVYFFILKLGFTT